MLRKICFYHADVEKYLDNVQKTNSKDWVKLQVLIQKLAEKGQSIINGRMYKRIKTGKNTKPNIVQIKIITKKYRIHTVLTPDQLYLIHAFDKKSDKTPKKDIALSVQRASNILNS